MVIGGCYGMLPPFSILRQHEASCHGGMTVLELTPLWIEFECSFSTLNGHLTALARNMLNGVA